MKAFDLKALTVTELDKRMMIEVNGGDSQPIPAPSSWWSIGAQIINAAYIVLTNAAKSYIEYSKETGGKYVIHHAY